jgi:hypothetical protein
MFLPSVTMGGKGTLAMPIFSCTNFSRKKFSANSYSWRIEHSLYPWGAKFVELLN